MSRILWHSAAPWCPSGYSQQTATFTPRIRDLGHDMAISAWYGLGGAILEYDGMQVYPGDNNHGNMLLPEIAKRHQADLVIALLDAWVLDPQRMQDLPLAVWAPVDHKPCPTGVAKFFKVSGATPIAMSRFGETMFREEGLDPLYVPHGIDTNIFKPLDREKIRKTYGVEDRFVVGIVANNSGGQHHSISRKSFPQSLVAFSAFYRDHPDALLYLHSELTGRPGRENGLDISRMLDRFEIPPEAVKITDQLAMETGTPQAAMAGLYSAFDVLLNPSMGEGFGVPIIEAQACGTPVIVSEWTAMTELCGAGWLVQGEPWYDAHPAQEAFFLNPNVGEIVAALKEAYEARGDQTLRDQAREFALAYDADLVTERYWVPALEKLGKPREIPPLPNRATRRAAAKKRTKVTA